MKNRAIELLETIICGKHDSTMAAKVYVSNLSWGTAEDDLRNLFAPFGTVVSVLLPRDVDSGKHRGFGFVEMNSQDEALAAIDALNNSEFQSRSIIVSMSRPQGERGSLSGTTRTPRSPRSGEPGSGGFGGFTG